MEQMNLLLSKSGSISQKEMETKVNAVTSRISANILSKISEERFEWQPSISAESTESFKISDLNEAQVNLLSTLNDMGRVTDVLRNLIFNSFLSNEVSDALFPEVMSIITMNFIDVFKAICPFMNIESDKTLKIQIVSEEIVDGIVRKSPNFIETLINSKAKVDIKESRWKKRMSKSDLSNSKKRRSRDNLTSMDVKRPKLDDIELQNNTNVDSQAKLSDVDDNELIVSIRSEHAEMVGDWKLVHKITSNGACLTNALSVAWNGSEDKSAKIRMDLNQHVVENFDLYRSTFVFPVEIITGVGNNRESHTFVDEDALKEFLLSEKSILMWNLECDLQAICNLHCTNISLFIYKKSGGYWLHLAPAYFQNASRDYIPNVVLYYEDQSHFDLLLPSNSGKYWQDWYKGRGLNCVVSDEIVDVKSPGEIVIINEGEIDENFHPVINKNDNGSMSIEVPHFEHTNHGKASFKFIKLNPKLEVTSQCSDIFIPTVKNFCRIRCIKFEDQHGHLLCFLCDKISKGTFACTTSGMLIHNSLHHNEIKLTKNHHIIRLDDSQNLDYTQGSMFIALDVRHDEVANFLDLKNLEGTLNPSSVKSLLYKKISILLGTDKHSRMNVASTFNENEEILREAYDFLINPFQKEKPGLFKNHLIRKYFGALIKIDVNTDIDFSRINKSEGPIYQDKTKQFFFQLKFQFPRKLNSFIYHSLLYILPPKVSRSDKFFLKEELLQEHNSRTILGKSGILFSEKMIFSSYSEVVSSRFTDVYRVYPNAKVQPNIKMFKRIGSQTGLKLDVMSRKTMLKQLSVELDYLVYKKVHQVVDKNHALKMKILAQKEPILTLFSSLYKQLMVNVHFIPFEDRAFLEKVLGAFGKWLTISNKAFKMEIASDEIFGNLSINTYNLLIDLVSNL